MLGIIAMCILGFMLVGQLFAAEPLVTDTGVTIVVEQEYYSIDFASRTEYYLTLAREHWKTNGGIPAGCIPEPYMCAYLLGALLDIQRRTQERELIEETQRQEFLLLLEQDQKEVDNE